MTAQLAVDVTLLESIASKLAVATQTFGDLAPSMPRAAGTSAGSAATAAILSHLATHAGYLCADLEIASDGVTATREAYGASDDSTWTTLQALGRFS